MSGRATQRERILALLSAEGGAPADDGAGWVPLPRLLALGVAQYNARIKELRTLGHRIESRSEWQGRARHTWFRLADSRGGARPKGKATPPTVTSASPNAGQQSGRANATTGTSACPDASLGRRGAARAVSARATSPPPSPSQSRLFPLPIHRVPV